MSLRDRFRRISADFQAFCVEQSKKHPADIADHNAEYWAKISKSAFDFIKNVIVAASLGVMADKTNSWLLYFVSLIMGFLSFSVLASQADRLIAYGFGMKARNRKWIALAGLFATIVTYVYFARVLAQVAAAIR